MANSKRTPTVDLSEEESPRKKSKITQNLSDDEILAISDAVARTEVALLLGARSTANIHTLWEMGRPVNELSGMKFKATEDLVSSWFIHTKILKLRDFPKLHIYVENNHRITIDT